jgi:hypothetical protein
VGSPAREQAVAAAGNTPTAASGSGNDQRNQDELGLQGKFN